MSNKYGYGWKFLTGAGTTEPDGYDTFEYSLPRRGEKWTEATRHPEPLNEPDEEDSCGPGRLHLMRRFDAQYAPSGWWPWYARYEKTDLVSKSDGKVGVKALQLRRVKPKVWWRMIRLGWLKGANLEGANLYVANLEGANLKGAYLYVPNLEGALNAQID